MCEAARWVPNCFNDQPFRFIVANKETNHHAWQKCLDSLFDWNKQWAANAPLFFICIANKTFKHNNAVNDWAEFDCGAACYSICLQATDLGLTAHQIGGFESLMLREHFNIKTENAILSVIAVGYQADESVLDGDYLTRELIERQRLEIKELFFDGDLNNPIVE